jgi:hypothetical protein
MEYKEQELRHIKRARWNLRNFSCEDQPRGPAQKHQNTQARLFAKWSICKTNSYDEAVVTATKPHPGIYTSPSHPDASRYVRLIPIYSAQGHHVEPQTV